MSNNNSPNISRRAVAQGLAWAAPVTPCDPYSAWNTWLTTQLSTVEPVGMLSYDVSNSTLTLKNENKIDANSYSTVSSIVIGYTTGLPTVKSVRQDYDLSSDGIPLVNTILIDPSRTISAINIEMDYTYIAHIGSNSNGDDFSFPSWTYVLNPETCDIEKATDPMDICDPESTWTEFFDSSRSPSISRDSTTGEYTILPGDIKHQYGFDLQEGDQVAIWADLIHSDHSVTKLGDAPTEYDGSDLPESAWHDRNKIPAVRGFDNLPYKTLSDIVVNYVIRSPNPQYYDGSPESKYYTSLGYSDTYIMSSRGCLVYS